MADVAKMSNNIRSEKWPEYDATNAWFTKVIGVSYGIRAMHSTLGRMLQPFASSSADSELTCGELDFLCEPTLAEEEEIMLDVPDGKSVKEALEAAEEEFRESDDVSAQLVDLYDNRATTALVDPYAYASAKAQLIAGVTEGTLQSGGIDSKPWHARRAMHENDMRRDRNRYPEYSAFIDWSGWVYSKVVSTFHGGAAKFTQQFVTGGTAPVGDGFSLLRSMKRSDAPQTVESAYDVLSKLFAIDMGKKSLKSYHAKFQSLVIKYQRLSQGMEGMEVGEKVLLVLYIQRLGSQYDALKSQIVASGDGLYEQTIDSLFARATNWAVVNGIPNVMGEDDHAKQPTAMNATASAISKGARRRMMKKLRKQAKAEVTEELFQTIGKPQAALAQQGSSKKRKPCPNCMKNCGKRSWECPLGYCGKCEREGKGKKTDHRAYRRAKDGEILCGKPGFDGTFSKKGVGKPPRQGRANAASDSSSVSDASRDAIMQRLTGSGWNVSDNLDSVYFGPSISHLECFGRCHCSNDSIEDSDASAAPSSVNSHAQQIDPMHGFANGHVNVVESAARERSNDAGVIGSPQKEVNFCSFSGCSTQVTAEPGPVKQSACLVFDVDDEDVEVPVRFEKGKSFPPRCAFWLWMCGIFVMLCATLCDHVRADTDMGLRCALDGIFICIVVGYIYALTIQSSFFVLNSVRANYHSVRLAGMLPAQSSTMALHFTEKWPAGGVFVDRFVREYPLIFFAKCLLYASNEFFHYFLMRFEYWNTSEYFSKDRKCCGVLPVFDPFGLYVCWVDRHNSPMRNAWGDVVMEERFSDGEFESVWFSLYRLVWLSLLTSRVGYGIVWLNVGLRCFQSSFRVLLECCTRPLRSNTMRPSVDKATKYFAYSFIVPLTILFGCFLSFSSYEAADTSRLFAGIPHSLQVEGTYCKTSLQRSHMHVASSDEVIYPQDHEFLVNPQGKGMSTGSQNQGLYALGPSVDNLTDERALSMPTSVQDEPVCYLDSGAVHHYFTKHYADVLFECWTPKDVYVSTAGSEKLPVESVGRIGKLSQALLVKGMSQNLISVSALLTDNTFGSIRFTPNEVYGTRGDGTEIVIANHTKGLYVCVNEALGLDRKGAKEAKEHYERAVKHHGSKALLSKPTMMLVGETICALGAVAGPVQNMVQTMHYRLMGAGKSTIETIARRKLLNNFPSLHQCTGLPWCAHCIAAKFTKLPFPKKSDFRAKQILELCHFDVFGPCKPEAVGGYRYACVIVDDYSRGRWVLLLKTKGELERKLREWQQRTESRWSKALGREIKLKTLRCDNAGENTSKGMVDWLFSHNLDMEKSVPGCSAQDGVAERHIRSTVAMAKHNLIAYRLPWKLWGLAMQDAANVSWYLPSDANEGKLTPFEKATKLKPDASHLRAFGSTVYCYLELPKRQQVHDSIASPKLLPACEVGICVGPAPDSKGWQIWFPKRQRVLVRRHCLFDERAHCDSHGHIKGHITGNQSGKLKEQEFDHNDPHISDRHRRFIGAVFERVVVDDEGKEHVVTGTVLAPFYNADSGQVIYGVIYNNGKYEDLPQSKLAVFLPNLSNVPVLKPNAASDSDDESDNEEQSVDEAKEEEMEPLDESNLPPSDDAPTCTLQSLGKADRHPEAPEVPAVFSPHHTRSGGSYNHDDPNSLGDESHGVAQYLGHTSVMETGYALLSMFPSLHRASNALSTMGLAFFSLFHSAYGGTALHSSTPYAAEQTLDAGWAFHAAQVADLSAFDEVHEGGITLEAFTARISGTVDIFRCGESVEEGGTYNGPTTRHVVWCLFQDSHGALLGRGDTSGVLARDVKVPLNLKQALNDPTWAKQWREAVHTELQNMVNAEVWEIIPIPSEGVDNFVDTKFVFRAKPSDTGGIEKFKARLVARGFTQVHGIDYTETFAPVIRGATFRMQCCDCVKKGLKAKQIDFEAAFLQSPVDNDIYLRLDKSAGVDVPEGYCIKLKKGLYGTKQAAFLWNGALVRLLLSEGFRRSVADPMLFIREDSNGYFTITAWVDDCCVCFSDEAAFKALYEKLNGVYPIGEVKDLVWHLGMRVSMTESYIEISLDRYIDDTLARFSSIMDTVRKGKHATPMRSEHASKPLCKADMPKNDSERLDPTVCPYRKLLGCLMFIAMWGRPDIATAVSLCARFQDNPGKRHWQALCHILAYLRQTQHKCIRYSNNAHQNDDLVAYVDADFANSDVDGLKSRTGYVFFWCGGPIVWRSTLQSLVAQSSCESELIALNACGKEAEWVRVLHAELTSGLFDHTESGVVPIMEDNTGAKALAENYYTSKRSRHFRVRLFHIRQQIRDGVCRVEYINTNDNVADLFTKPLQAQKFLPFRDSLVVDPLSKPSSLGETKRAAQ